MCTQPHTVIQELTLIQSKSMKDFATPRGDRQMMMPYWYRNDDGTMAFQYINTKTDPKELQREIKEGRIYIRHPESTMKVTEFKK